VYSFPFRVSREFSVRWYNAEDKTLCFHAARGPSEPTEVHLIFEGIREMRVRQNLRDVTVDQIDGGYSLTTTDFPDGYLLCEKFHYAEDDVEDWDTFSSLDEHVIKRWYHPRP
jgi:hypothetical protein